jgi:lipoteichoic acid synthase
MMSAVFGVVWVAVLWAKLRWLTAELLIPGFPLHQASRSSTLSVLLILIAPIISMSPQAAWIALLVLDILLTILALADVWHFRFYGDVLSMASLSDLPQLRRVWPAVGALIRSKDHLMLVDIGAGLLLFPLVRGISDDGFRSSLFAVGGFATAGLMAAIPALRLLKSDPEEVFEYIFQRRQVVGAIGLLPYHAYDLGISSIQYFSKRMKAGIDLPEIEQLVTERRSIGEQSPFFGAARGLNIIVVSAEALQGFTIELEIDGHPLAPNLAAFSKESLKFTQFHDQTHLGTTADAEWMALQSLYPPGRGAISTRFSANEFWALPSILVEHGYATVSACAEPPDFWNMRQMHPRLGFQKTYFDPDYKAAEWVGIGLPDDEFFEQTVVKLEEAEQPFFSYLITSSVHAPFALPLSLRHFDPGRHHGTIVGDYFQSIHYFDSAFGGFIDHLKKTGLLDRSLIVVFGDHQAHISKEFAEAGLSPSPSAQNDSDTTDFEFYRQWKTTHDVPLLIRFPNAAHCGVRETPGGHLDIAPTIMSFAGIMEDRAVMLGSDLTVTRQAPLIFRDGSVVDGSRIFIQTTNRCYDYKTGVPMKGDLRNLASLARHDLEVSDEIIHRNLIRRIAGIDASETMVPPPAQVLVIAHRGDSKKFPENTLLAINSALDIGSDIVEVDVRLSRDGVPIIIHNDTLDETTNGQGLVAEKTVAELKSLDAGEWKNPRFKGERIPTLEEALELVRGRGRLLIDVNAEGIADMIARIYRRLAVPEEEAVIGAWTGAQIQDYARAMPRALILHSSGRPDHSDFTGFKTLGARGFEIGDCWPPKFIRAARRNGMTVIAYTINDEGTMRRLIRMGVDGIETDDPELAASVCARLIPD